MKDNNIFPVLPIEEWEETKNTLHLFLQIIGKIRLKTFPKMNHSLRPLMGGVYRANLDGTNLQIVADLPEGSALADLALDPRPKRLGVSEDRIGLFFNGKLTKGVKAADEMILLMKAFWNL